MNSQRNGTKRSLVAVAAATTCLAMAGPAAAETISIWDQPKDYPGMPASGDIRDVAVTNDANGVTFKVKMRDLKGGTSVVGFNVGPVDQSMSFGVQVVRFKNGRIRNNISVSDGEDYWTTTCSGLKSTWKNKRNLITVQVPWTCLHDQRTTLRVSAFFGFGDGTAGDPSDWTKSAKVRHQ